MAITIALAGNPNCGKTTLFNSLTGGTEYVGNWAGVTVEKKDGYLKGTNKEVIIQDLPGIYSLSPYTLEETVSRRYLVNERPDAIINIIDGTNIERNLYLTTQLLELSIPVVMAVNMMDLVKANGDTINLEAMAKEMGCAVMPISALKDEGCEEAAQRAVAAAKAAQKQPLPHIYNGSVEHAIAHIEESIDKYTTPEKLRWYAIKLFERDEDATKELSLPVELVKHIETHIAECEKEMDDDSESVIINQRYAYIGSIIDKCVTKARAEGSLTTSDKIDKIVTNRILALPIFAVIIWLMYYISVTTLGGFLTDWTNDVFFGEIVTDAATGFMESIEAPDWLSGLVIDGIIGGVGTVLGFVPQIMLIFFILSFLEDCGYMARVAFIMDRIFRRFGLSGKSFIPILIGTGCGVPAVMAARTIEDERDRRMTIMLSTFIPCGAKSVIIGCIVGAFFPDSSMMAPGMYFLGIAVIVLSGIAFKKTALFAGEPAPFVMELPAYHMPTLKGLIIHMWERGKAFIIKAFTIIFVACMVIWFTQSFGWDLEMVEDVEQSILATIGGWFAWIFAPLGFGDWKGAVAVVAAEMAKEDAVGTLAVLAGAASDEEEAIMESLATMFTPMAAFSFMVLNLFDPPCMAAIATIVREMDTKKWAAIAIFYQIFLGYAMAFVCYQLGMVFVEGEPFGVGAGIAVLLVLVALYFILRPAPKPEAEPVEA